MLLIVEPVGQRGERSEQEGRQVYDEMLRFADSLRQRGSLRDAQSLRSEASGAPLQVGNGKRMQTDGPFAETKEMVGGFFLLECDSKEEAIAIAAECPAARFATIEVRELGPCFT